MDIKEIKRKKLEKMKKEIEIRNETKELIIEVNDDDFKEKVIEKSKKVPIVVDFWAEWCMPCLILKPVLEKLVKEYKGKFILAKLNVDKSPLTSQAYGIMSIPAVKLFKNGKVVAEFIGALPEEAVREWLDKNL